MRRIIIVPIFHTPADMGSLRDKMEEVSSEEFGRVDWEEHKRKIENFWNNVEENIEKILEKEDINKVKIYQDGQVLDGQSEMGRKILMEVAERGSINHRIILSILNKGARLMKTESFELLKEEYRLIKNIITAKDKKDAEIAVMEYRKKKKDLLVQRDRYIARIINTSLKTGELGILFIGAAHNVEKYLARDFEIRHLKFF